MKNDQIYIRRAPRNAQHPYMQLFRKIPQNLELSLEARGLLIYILSLPLSWIGNIADMGKKNGIGRDKTRALIKDLENAGYCKVFKRKIKGKFCGCYYYFSEDKQFDIEMIEEDLQKPEPEIQGVDDEKQPAPENPAPEIQSLEISHGLPEKDSPHTLYGDTTSFKSKDKPPIPQKGEPAKAGEKRKKLSIDFSEEVKELANAVIAAIVSVKPDFAVPVNKVPLMTSLDLMLRIDKRDPQKILDVLRWALSDPFWADKMLKSNVAEYLRKDNRLDALDAKMNAKSFGNSKVDRRTRNQDGTPVDAPHLKDLF